MSTTRLDPEGRRGPFLVIHLGWKSQRWAEEEEEGSSYWDYHLRKPQEFGGCVEGVWKMVWEMGGAVLGRY